MQYSPNLLVVMDSLWFQHAILFSEPVSLLPLKASATPPPPSSQLPDISLTQPLGHEEILSDTSSPASPKDTPDDATDTTQEEEDVNKINDNMRSRQNFTKKNRSHSSSSSIHKLNKHLRNINAIPLKKSMSLVELEHEELRGFIDLGFTFKKEELSPRMMSVIPGLQRLREDEDDDIEEFRREEEGIMRPYLSETWLVKRPDSPLLNMRILRVLSSHGMKAYLRHWARTVASTIQFEY